MNMDVGFCFELVQQRAQDIFDIPYELLHDGERYFFGHVTL
jgi:hypothetical protein